MARDMTPVLKRCRSLGLNPTFLGIDKKSNRSARAGRKPSEYSLQLKEKQKAKFIYMEYLRSLSVTIMRRLVSLSMEQQVRTL